MVTIHDCDGKLVAYNLSTSAYSIKSHPRSIKRSLQASTDDPEDTGNSRSKRRRGNSALASTSTISTVGNRAPPPNSSVAGGSNQQQLGSSANTGGPPIVEPVVDRPGEATIPMDDPRLQSVLQEARRLLSLSPIEGPQPLPTLDEAVPASCSWRGGIVISLLVHNLPQDGPVYARFGHIVVKTVGVQCSIQFNEVCLSLEPGSEDPPHAGMQGPSGDRPMRSRCHALQRQWRS